MLTARLPSCARVVDAGVNHIDTSDFYGPHITNRIIRRALHPYRDGLVVVTKVGARRGEDKSWLHCPSLGGLKPSPLGDGFQRARRG
jgi:aryl-alcohol dehydrogenase-like predicted oxidoreductase